MRLFYYDEGPIDTLLQIADRPTHDGDLVSKSNRAELVRLGWVARCEGYNIITALGRDVIRVLKLMRMAPHENASGPVAVPDTVMRAEVGRPRERDGERA